MDIMFKKGDVVVYGKNGICSVDDVKEMDFAGEKGMYYVLKPKSSHGSTVYVPLSKENLVSKLRSVMTKNEIDMLIESTRNDEIKWSDSKNERHEKFNEIVLGGNSRELLLLVSCLYLKKQERESMGKHLSSTDEGILKVAERLIEEEFSMALECTPGEVSQYISNKLSE